MFLPLSQQHYGDLKDSDESSDDDDDYDSSSRTHGRKRKKGYFEKIKWGHVALLLMMVGGGLAPLFILIADNAGPLLGKVSLLRTKMAFETTSEWRAAHAPFLLHLLLLLVPSTTMKYMPNFNLAPTMVSLGLMQTPKKRLVDFYQKHNQTDKLADDLVDATIMKYAGDYPTLIKKLERKYQDYGYFIGWEQEGGLADVQKKTYQVRAPPADTFFGESSTQDGRHKKRRKHAGRREERERERRQAMRAFDLCLFTSNHSFCVHASLCQPTRQWVTDNGGRVYQRYVPFPIRNGVKRAMFNLERFYKIAYKKLDKWTAAPAAGSKKKSKKSGSTTKSRRARNNQARDD